MEYIATKADGGEIRYADDKKWLWLSGVAIAALSISVLAIFAFGVSAPALLLFPIVFFYGVIPIVDFLVGGDTNNPPEEVVRELSADRHYERVAYALIPGHYVLFIFSAWIVATQSPPLWAVLGLALGVGLINGNLINIGHELGHKTDRRNQMAAKFAFIMSGYGHFTIEHNRGHHVMVSTPEDCASARLGESVYAFALRELPGAFRGGWAQEKKRLSRLGLPAFHWKNEILQVYAMSAAFNLVVLLWLGWGALLFLLVHHFYSWFALTMVNYIEHYGLLRQKRENGKYEPCAPRHSWNSNHLVSNLMLLHLQRHSDHHANPMRPYQALRDFDDVPSLPSGYPGSLVLAAIPPLWFKVMDPKVMDWAGGDLEKVNLCPRNAHRYGA